MVLPRIENYDGEKGILEGMTLEHQEYAEKDYAVDRNLGTLPEIVETEKPTLKSLKIITDSRHHVYRVIKRDVENSVASAVRIKKPRLILEIAKAYKKTLETLSE